MPLFTTFYDYISTVCHCHMVLYLGFKFGAGGRNISSINLPIIISFNLNTLLLHNFTFHIPNPSSSIQRATPLGNGVHLQNRWVSYNSVDVGSTTVRSFWIMGMYLLLWKIHYHWNSGKSKPWACVIKLSHQSEIDRRFGRNAVDKHLRLRAILILLASVRHRNFARS